MAGHVWVFTEHFRGQISEATFESLALGRELAEQLGVQLHAVLLGHNAKELTGVLGKADAAIWVDDPALAEPIPDTTCEAMAQLVKAKKPGYVLVPLTNVSMDVAAMLSASLPAPFINWCRDVRVVSGAVQGYSLLYGGKMEVVAVAAAEPAILGILPGVRSVDAGRAAQAPAAIEEFKVTWTAAPRVRFSRYIEAEAGDVDITKQDVLVSVGRGIQTKDNIELADELAEALGGAVAGSRPVIDQGWLPLSRQVGKSGVTVKPKLYLALGISGAPEHVEGMKSATLIIAINTDPNAPIFNVAHYGVVADALELLPLLTQEVRKVGSKKGN